jgi:hypothetical protein
VTYEHDEENTTHGIPGGIGLKIGIVGEFGSIKSLYFHTLVEAKVGDADPEPSYKTRNTCQGGEIGKN